MKDQSVNSAAKGRGETPFLSWGLEGKPHKITEYPEIEGTHKDQLQALHRAPQQSPAVPESVAQRHLELFQA